MNILLICSEYPPFPAGGIGTWTRAFARALVANGDKVWVAGLYDIRKRREEDDQGVKVIRIPYHSHIPKIRAFANRLNLHSEISRILRKSRIEIIEAPDYRGELALYRSDVPYVVRLHTLPKRWADEATTISPSWFERVNLERSDTLIAVSGWAKTITSDYYKNYSRIHVVYYTLANDFILPPKMTIPREEATVVFAGTLADHKGVWELAEAWKIVKCAHPTARLIFIGKDSKPQNTQYSNKERLQDKLFSLDAIFLGEITQYELGNWYRRATVACFPSKTETFGLVAAEAMACNTPVIYTKVGPGPEITGNGTRAMMIDPRNPKEIAQSIINVLDNPMHFNDQVIRARKWVVENLTPDVTVNKTREIYEKLVKNTSGQK